MPAYDWSPAARTEMRGGIAADGGGKALGAVRRRRLGQWIKWIMEETRGGFVSRILSRFGLSGYAWPEPRMTIYLGR